MKQADPCWGSGVPTLNQTGLLKLKIWCRSAYASSCSKISASAGEAKYLWSSPAFRYVFTMRSMSCLRLTSRCGVPTAPRMLLAGDDVDRVHRPEAGELDATLLEIDRAVAPVGHDDVTALPFHLVVQYTPGVVWMRSMRSPLLALVPLAREPRAGPLARLCPCRLPVSG